MKSKKIHQRNHSMHQHAGYNDQFHQRSFSYQKNYNKMHEHAQLQQPSNEILISASSTLPNQQDLKQKRYIFKKSVQFQKSARKEQSPQKFKSKNIQKDFKKLKPKPEKEKISSVKEILFKSNSVKLRKSKSGEKKKQTKPMKKVQSIEKRYKKSKEHQNQSKSKDKSHSSRKKSTKRINQIAANKKQKITKTKIVQKSQVPNWKKVCESFQEHLTQQEILQIKEHKFIYFLGKIHDRIKSNPSTKRQKVSFQQNNDTFKDVSMSPRFDQKQKEHSNQKFDDIEGQFYEYEIGDHIAYRYQIINSINRGSFGEVIKVYDHKNKEFYALKIVKKCQQLVQQTFVQISILTHIKEKDKANLSGIVRIKDFTIFRNHICIIFQLLEGNLYELLQANHFNGFNDETVRIFAVQILNSLNFLQQQSIIHCDIKPENIVMKKWGKSGIKLVDFGTSCFEGKQIYEYLQSRYYRAPQIIMRMPYSFPIDLWSFGCLIAELKIGQPIYAAASNLEQLLYICKSIGFPRKSDGIYSTAFLENQEIKQIINQQYIQKYQGLHGKSQKVIKDDFFGKFKYPHQCMKSLFDKMRSKGNCDENFLNFLSKILVWEPQKRLRPSEALLDPWIVKGLPNDIRELYTVFNTIECSNSKEKNENSKKKSKPKKKSTSKESKKSKNKLKQQSQAHNAEKDRAKFSFPKGRFEFKSNEKTSKNSFEFSKISSKYANSTQIHNKNKNSSTKQS